MHAHGKVCSSNHKHIMISSLFSGFCYSICTTNIHCWKIPPVTNSTFFKYKNIFVLEKYFFFFFTPCHYDGVSLKPRFNLFCSKVLCCTDQSSTDISFRIILKTHHRTSFSNIRKAVGEQWKTGKRKRQNSWQFPVVARGKKKKIQEECSRHFSLNEVDLVWQIEYSVIS